MASKYILSKEEIAAIEEAWKKNKGKTCRCSAEGTGVTSYTSNGEFSLRHDPAGNEEGEKESRCGVAAPQRPGLSIYITSIF